MKNITITLDEENRRMEARVEAAKHNKSVSYVWSARCCISTWGESAPEYEEAMRRYLAIKPYKFEKARRTIAHARGTV